MQKLCRWIFKMTGWSIEGELPPDKKFIIIVAPHTSNWDFFVCLCARFIIGTRINFLAKSQLFFFPIGSILKALGGAPVDRSKKGNTVETVVELFRHSDVLKLAITPEGTRAPVTRWKEGFYHMACQAGIPIIMIGPDYESKQIRIQKPFWPCHDIAQDFPKFIQFFRTIKGYRPKAIPDYHPKSE